MKEIEIKQRLKEYISRSIKDYTIKDDDNLIELGLVHSLFIIQLIIFIEKQFKVELDDSFDIDSITTINSIYDIIIEHQAQLKTI